MIYTPVPPTSVWTFHVPLVELRSGEVVRLPFSTNGRTVMFTSSSVGLLRTSEYYLHVCKHALKPHSRLCLYLCRDCNTIELPATPFGEIGSRADIRKAKANCVLLPIDK